LATVSGPIINDNGDVVFRGSFAGGSGIFTPTNLLVGAGDTVDGKTLTDTSDPFITDNGDVVFLGSFAGGSGVHLAFIPQTVSQLTCGPNTFEFSGECVPVESLAFCGFGTVQQGNECVVDPSITDQLDQALADLAAALAQIIQLQTILTSGEIEVCHDSETKIVNLGGLAGHLTHGDTIGTCP
jgi:hypothetical protein